MPRNKFHTTPKSTATTKAATTSTTGEQLPKTTNDLLEDFRVPDDLRKSLEYPAQRTKEAMRLEHLEKKLTEEFEVIQQRLKSEKTKVSLKRKGDSIVMVATLPLKPNDTHPKGLDSKQYQVTVNGKGFPFNLDGINEAYLEAKQLGKLIATRTFTWSEKYFKQTPEEIEKPKTIGEMLEEFEKLYFMTRKRNRQSESSYNVHYCHLNKYLPRGTMLSDSVIIEAITKTDSGTGSRQTVTNALSVFCNTFKYQFNFKGYKDGYKPKARKIPTNTEIEQFYGVFSLRQSPKFQSDAYNWMYGILATYGIRPHELFAIDFEKFLSHDNTLNALYLDEAITDGIKTGSRVVFPLHPEWVELFYVKNVKQSYNNGSLKGKVSCISENFRKSEIPFEPYDLRHAYAIRGHALGIPLKEMADNMGHSVDMHTKTYQKYMTLDTRKQVYTDAIKRNVEQQAKKTEVELLKEENERLKAQLATAESTITQLTLEIHRLKLDSVYHS